MYDIIPSPAPGAYIVRASDQESFRPAAFCASKDGIEASHLKIRMEQAEVDSTRALNMSSIACAAHFSPELATQNATSELVERVSLAAWWAFRRGGITQRPAMHDHLLDELPLGDKHALTVGEIPSVTADQSVWVSVIETSVYPYAVLGAASSLDPEDAARHAYHESLLSYGASVWLHKTQPHATPRWDFGELHARTQAVDTQRTIGTAESAAELMHRIDAEYVVYRLGEISVVHIVSPLFPSYNTANLANLVRQPHEKIVVRTEANL